MNAGMRMKNETNSSKTGVNALFLKNEMAPNGPKLVSQPHYSPESNLVKNRMPEEPST